MASNTSTPKARALGQALRDERKARGISLRTLSARIGKDPSQVSRWETGARAPKETDLAQMLAHLGINGERYDEMLEMCHGTDKSNWLAVSLPEQRQQLSALLDFEHVAESIVDTTPLLMPGLLQTSEYARAMMRAGKVPDDEIETRVAIRVGRRDVLTRRNPVQYTALIGEAALRQTIGSAEIMAEQLGLLQDVSERPNIDLRVLPFSSGWHPALEGPAVLIETPEMALVHIENRRSGLFFHDPDDVAFYREAVAILRDVAMGPAHSTAFIGQLKREREAQP